MSDSQAHAVRNAFFFFFTLLPAVTVLPALLSASLTGRHARRNLPVASMCAALIIVGLCRSLAIFGTGFRVWDMLIPHGLCSAQTALVSGTDLMLSFVVFGLVHAAVQLLRVARQGTLPPSSKTGRASLILPYVLWALISAVLGYLAHFYGPHDNTQLVTPEHWEGLPYCENIKMLACGPRRAFGIPACQADAIMAEVVLMLASWLMSCFLVVYGFYGSYLLVRVRTTVEAWANLDKATFWRHVAAATLLWISLQLRYSILGSHHVARLIGDWVLVASSNLVVLIYGSQKEVWEMWSLWAHAGISYIRERVLSRRPRGIRLPEDEDESA